MRLQEKIILTLFQLGSRNDDYSKVELLLKQLKEQGVTNFNFVSPYGDSMAHICSFYQLTNTFKNIVQFCKENNIQFDYFAGDTKQNQTPLQIACITCNLDLVRFLLEAGHPIDVKDNTGKEAIHYAACSTNLILKQEIINLLKSKGACMDAVDNNDISAQSILDHVGINPKTGKDFMNMSSLHWLIYKSGAFNLKLSKIAKNYDVGTLKIIEEETFNQYILTQLPSEIQTDDFKKELNQFRVDLLAINDYVRKDPHQLLERTDGGRTALMLACYLGFKWAVMLFLDKDLECVRQCDISQVEQTDNQGMNALHFASFDFRNTNQEIVTMLLNKNCKNQVSKLGTTASTTAKLYDFYNIAADIEKSELLELTVQFNTPFIISAKNTEQPKADLSVNDWWAKRKSARF